MTVSTVRPKLKAVRMCFFSFTDDEVIEWNGRNLCGLTFDEVYDIIYESKQEPQVELIVHRPIR